MKPKPKLISPITALSITAALAISGPVHGAITWDPVPTTNLGANTPFTFTNSELNPLVSDVELDFTSSHAGGIETGTFAGRIIYKNDALISAGETISFNFDFNFQLASGVVRNLPRSLCVCTVQYVAGGRHGKSDDVWWQRHAPELFRHECQCTVTAHDGPYQCRCARVQCGWCDGQSARVHPQLVY